MPLGALPALNLKMNEYMHGAISPTSKQIHSKLITEEAELQAGHFEKEHNEVITTEDDVMNVYNDKLIIKQIKKSTLKFGNCWPMFVVRNDFAN